MGSIVGVSLQTHRPHLMNSVGAVDVAVVLWTREQVDALRVCRGPDLRAEIGIECLGSYLSAGGGLAGLAKDVREAVRCK